ncbi:MAG: lamin tail domain-containing protein [Bacteroidota bacterium]
MRYTKLLTILFCIFSYTLSAQVLINEVQSSDTNTIKDEDGEYQGWIELFNTGNAAVDLNNYGLTDDQAKPYKWTFPGVSIQPHDYVFVFTSGKNRKKIINHWETSVFSYDYWRYFIGTSEPPSNWKDINFNDSGWPLGKGGFGYGDGDDSTLVPVGTLSVYLRKTFNIADTSKIGSAIFSIDYDDGFVAYLNGTEIARNNVSGTPPPYNTNATASHEAQMYQGGTPENYTINQTLLKSLLVNGNNVLDIQVYNIDTNSSDLSAIPFLSFGISDNSVLFSPPPVWFSDSAYGYLHTDFKIDINGETIVLTTPAGVIADQKFSGYIATGNALARIPDGFSSWCITDIPTPHQSNNSSSCYSGYSPKPTFSLAPGFYSGAQYISISSSLAGAEIHYTVNGSIPKVTDPLYTAPVAVDTTTVLRAKGFGPSGYLPGLTATNTYLINENTTLTTISISTDSTNLWGPTGIYDNYSENWQRECHIECFAPMGKQRFELEATMNMYGGYSCSFPQKSFRMQTDSWLDSSYINYPLFPDKDIHSFKSFVLRNSGNDWFYTYFRDALEQKAVRNTDADWNAYRPCIAYINGVYWGIYNIREKNDKYFPEENHGANHDSVDMVRNDYNTGVFVESGNMDAYSNMYNFIANNDISTSTNYNIAKSMLDVNNFTDYFIAETYYINDDWIGYCINNIKLWRERKPNSKWRYILSDLDIALGFNWAWIRCNYERDKLSEAVNTTLTNDHSTMLKKLLQNNEFKTYFINRYADLINTIFLPANMNQLINGMRDSIAAEMPRALLRWQGSGYGSASMSEWYSNIDTVVEFVNNRPLYARNYIQDLFSLTGQVNVTLNTNPPGAGKIKISTVIPDSLPWTGVYFNGNPVTITAIPNPGYTFLNWQPNTSIPSGNTNQSITLNIAYSEPFVANFAGSPAQAKITFSEINYHSDPGRNAGDWIELHNYGSTSLDISDWYFQDENFYNKYIFPTGTVVPQNGYFVLSSDTSLFISRFPALHPDGYLSFNFSNSGEKLSLFDNFGNPVKVVIYDDSIPWPKCADGYGRTLELKSDSANLNDGHNWFGGCIEGSPGAPFSACNEPIIFSEVNYNSSSTADAGDWAEIHNTTAYPIDLSGWKFTDDNDQHIFTIQPNTVLQGKGYLVLFRDSLKFTSQHPLVTDKCGPFSFGLSSAGDILRLYNPLSGINFSMAYDVIQPWPVLANGGGYTLEHDTTKNDFSDGTSWFAGCPGGSPGEPYSSPCSASVHEQSSIISIRIYPNPAQENLMIDYTLDKDSYFILCDILGTQRKSITLDSGAKTERIILTGLPDGFYVYSICDKNGNKIKTGKLIIQK